MTARRRLLTYEGETKTLREWAELMGVSHQVLRYRLDAGWSVEEALGKPLQPAGRPSAAAVRAHRTNDEARLRMRLARADFAQLVKDIDRALTAFNRQLSILSAETPGVVKNFADDLKDRATPSTQETT